MLRYKRLEVYVPVATGELVKDLATMQGLSTAEYCRRAIVEQARTDERVNRNYLDKLYDLRRHHVVREG